METRLEKNRKEENILYRLRIGHPRQHILTWSKAATNILCMSHQKYIVKHIFIECTSLAYIKETFYSANDMNELFPPKIKMNHEMSFLKTLNWFRKILCLNCLK